MSEGTRTIQIFAAGVRDIGENQDTFGSGSLLKAFGTSIMAINGTTGDHQREGSHNLDGVGPKASGIIEAMSTNIEGLTGIVSKESNGLE